MDKWFVTSKTIQGIVVMALPILRTIFGWEWATAEAGADLSLVIDQLITLVGGGWALYGRVTATKTISVVPVSTTPTPPPTPPAV